nr:MAG TPA: hypothetical protein [Caudoviricetes sp.]
MFHFELKRKSFCFSSFFVELTISLCSLLV